MTLLLKEPVKRVEKLLKEFSQNQKVISLDSSARTALEAASSLGCEVGAIVKSLLFKTENFPLRQSTYMSTGITTSKDTCVLDNTVHYRVLVPFRTP